MPLNLKPCTLNELPVYACVTPFPLWLEKRFPIRCLRRNRYIRLMQGIVLTGGQSIRMGTDKGMLRFNHQTWVERAVTLLESFRIPVAVSINPNQYLNYAALFSPGQLIEDDASLTVGGPLRGILSAHLRFPLEDLLVLACDMPCMQAEPIQFLLQQATADAVLFQQAGRPEALCGIYRATALHRLLMYYADAAQTNYSLRHALEQVQPLLFELPDAWQACFRNMNSPHDCL